jgi:hypothetical protein
MTYSDELFSDIFKNSHGYRPSQDLCAEWDERTPRQKQELWDAMMDMIADQERDQKEIDAARVRWFENYIKQYMGYGSNITRADAIRLILDEKSLLNEYDPQYVCFELELPYNEGYEQEFAPLLRGSVEERFAPEGVL